MSVFRSVSKSVFPSVHRASNVPAALLDVDGVQPVVNYLTLMVAVGDSITAGQGGISGYPDTQGVTYHELYATNNETGLLVAENRAVGGSGLSSAAAGAAALDARIAANSGKDIYCLIVAWGRNDGDLTAASYNGGASWIDQMKTYLTARRSAGWNKIIVCTVTPYDVETEPSRVNREAGNDLIRGLVGSGHADGICDYGNSETSLMGNVAAHTGDTYYQDYVHPTVRGHFEMYKVFTPVANAVLTLATKAATPVILPLGDNYTSAQSVTITTVTEAATIYYTRDGSTPDNTKLVYSSPLTVGNETIKAIAIKSGLTDSSINSQAYEVVSGLYWNEADTSMFGPTYTYSLSKGKKKLTPINGDGNSYIRGNIKLPLTGKHLIEVICADKAGSGAVFAGLAMIESTRALGSSVQANYADWQTIVNWWQLRTNGSMLAAGTAATGTSSGLWNGTFANPERMMIAIDMDSGKAWHSKTGASWAVGPLTSANPVTGVQPHWTFTPSANWWFAAFIYQGVATNPSFELPDAAGVTGTVPSGYTIFNA